jgi:hypothetical protein
MWFVMLSHKNNAVRDAETGSFAIAESGNYCYYIG